MDDPKTRYGASTDRASVARSHVPGYLSSEAPLSMPHDTYDPTDLHGSVLRPYFPGYLSSEPPSLLAHHDDFPGASSNLLQRDRGSLGPGAYAVDNISGVGVRPELGMGVTAGVSIQGYPSALEDPNITAGVSIQGYPSLLAHHDDMLGASSNLLQRDIGSLGPGAYAVDNIPGVGVRPELGIGVTAGVSIQGYSSALEDPTLLSRRQDFSVGISPRVNVERSTERPSYFRNDNGFTDLKGESNVLFVDGLPTDCTRREVGHLFRPFIGFREIKVVHKGPRRNGDKAMVLCFVEFVNEKCALTAMEALQGYKFDNKKPDSPVLRIQFAHFPFSLPSYHDEKQIRR